MRKHIKTILTIVLSAFLFLGTVNITSHVYAEAGEQSSESLGDAEETSETTSQDDAQETLEESPESSSDTGSENVDETLEDGSGDGVDSEELSTKTTTTDTMTGASTTLTTTTVEEPEDLHDFSVEELFEYLLSIDSDKFDELYDKYDDLDSILECLSDAQAETIQEKFGSSEGNAEETSVVNYRLNASGGTLRGKYGLEVDASSATGLESGLGKHYSSSSDCKTVGYANYDFGNTMTISVKISFDSFDLSNSVEFFGNWEAGGFGLGYAPSNDCFYLTLYTNGAYYKEVVKNTIGTYEEHWITGVYDATADRIGVYIDGVLQAAYRAEVVDKGLIGKSTAPFGIGGNPDASSSTNWYLPFNCGTIYKAGVWTSALSQEEITDMIDNDYINSSALINQDWTPQKEGYTFLGYYYDSSDESSKLTSTSAYTEGVCYYAKWTESPLVNYSTNDSNAGTVSKTSEYVSSSVNSPYGATAIVAKDNYHFDGWYGEDPNYKISDEETLKPGKATLFKGLSNTSYYGGTYSYDTSNKVYNVITSTSSMNSNWGSGVSLNSSELIPYNKWYIVSFEIYAPVSSSVVIDINNYVNSGDNLNGNDNDFGPSSAEKNRIFYLEGNQTSSSNQFSVAANNWYKVTFGYKNSRSDNTSKIPIIDYSGIGFVHDTSLGNQTFKIRNVQEMIADNYLGSAGNYTAIFAQDKYTVIFNGNGNTGGTEVAEGNTEYSEKYGVGDFTKNLRNYFVKDGYYFCGWNTSSDGSGTSYEGNKYLYYTDLSEENGAAVTLYAQWKKKFDLVVRNTVNGNMGSKTQEFVITANFPKIQFGTESLKYTKSDGSTGTLTINSQGKATFSLKDGETITFSNLADYQYAVIDLNNNNIYYAYNLFNTDYDNPTDYKYEATLTRSETAQTIAFSETRNSAVPTGNHNNDAYLWLTLIGIIGIAGIVLSRTFLKQS